MPAISTDKLFVPTFKLIYNVGFIGREQVYTTREEAQKIIDNCCQEYHFRPEDFEVLTLSDFIYREKESAVFYESRGDDI